MIIDGLERKWEIRRISIFSLFKFIFCFQFITTFSLYLIIKLNNITAIDLSSFLIHLTSCLNKLTEKYSLIFENSFLTAAIIALMMSLMVSILFVIFALIYILLTMVIGGIVIKVRERDPKTPFL